MITITEMAAKKIADLRLEEGKPEWGLRIRVVGGGCSGMSYELGWEDASATDDNVVEAHAPMAETKLREIGEEARCRWPGVKCVAMFHRVGRLEIGEASVLIAVSASHRGEAFEACRWAIDTLKATVPVWKKEHFEDGEVWVGLQGG